MSGFSFIYLQCIKLINLSEGKIIIGLSEGYINTIKHEIKTEPEFNHLLLFLILFLFLLNLYPIRKSINHILHIFPFLFSKFILIYL